DENGFVVCDKDGEPLIHTDGTGFISEELAILCAKHFIEAKGSKDESYEFVDLLKLEEESLGMEGLSDPPLLVQCRIFKDGYAVKGTLLVNKKIDLKLSSSDGQLGLRGTVVFLHGAPTQSYSYRVVMSQLADVRFQCYVPDWLGSGFDGFDYTSI
ncbi:probable RNA-dependent RNA polymerase 3 isoform X1, partial [Tanacetum coccineum]